MSKLEKVIKELEETEIMLKQAVDRGGEMAVMGAFKCYNHVSDAISLLKEQETVPVYEDKNNKCECGEIVCRYWHPKFCGFCGRELLWY